MARHAPDKTPPRAGMSGEALAATPVVGAQAEGQAPRPPPPSTASASSAASGGAAAAVTQSARGHSFFDELASPRQQQRRPARPAAVSAAARPAMAKGTDTPQSEIIIAETCPINARTTAGGARSPNSFAPYEPTDLDVASGTGRAEGRRAVAGAGWKPAEVEHRRAGFGFGKAYGSDMEDERGSENAS